MPYTYSNSVLWDSWISDFNDDDDSSEHVCVCVVTSQELFPDLCVVKWIVSTVEKKIFTGTIFHILPLFVKTQISQKPHCISGKNTEQ